MEGLDLWACESIAVGAPEIPAYFQPYLIFEFPQPPSPEHQGRQIFSVVAEEGHQANMTKFAFITLLELSIQLYHLYTRGRVEDFPFFNYSPQ